MAQPTTLNLPQGNTPSLGSTKPRKKSRRRRGVARAIGRAYAQTGSQVGKPKGSTSVKTTSRKPLLSVATQLGARTNSVASGAGSQRTGQKYQVKTDANGNYFHVYGRGKNARRVKLSSDVAKTYGYTS